jgi:ribonuclease G
MENDSLAELLIERSSERSVVGNIAKGRVSRVLPGMQAAFVDIGLDKAAFLYAGDYLADLEEENPGRGRRRGRNGSRAIPRIDTLLSEGQEIVVQIAKEPIGTKGARITSHLAIAGRHLVLTPAGSRVGVSRRIDSDKERRRLREIVSRLRPKGMGFIIRTAGEDAREEDLEADIKYLSSVWEALSEKRESARVPSVLYEEPSLPLRVIRDVANSETKRVMVDSLEVHEEIQNFVARFIADPKPKIERHTGPEAIFERHGVEAEIDANLGRKVWLKSGGYLIIDQSEALTAIDVNTGRFVGKRDLEETVFKTNLEAVKEVVHQLRFRNIGGLIVIDLIDMEAADNREKVYRALQDAVRSDKARTNILKISELGLVEMTRKRTRENLVQQLCEPCGYCDGKGYVLSRESVTFKVLRDIRKDLAHIASREIAISVHPRVAETLLGPMKEALTELSAEVGREIEVRAKPGMHQEQFEVLALGAAEPVELNVPWLVGGATNGSSAPLVDGVDGDDEDEEPLVEFDGGGEESASATPALEEDAALSLESEEGDDEEPKDPETDAAAVLKPVDGPSEFRILPRSGEEEA